MFIVNLIICDNLHLSTTNYRKTLIFFLPFECYGYILKPLSEISLITAFFLNQPAGVPTSIRLPSGS